MRRGVSQEIDAEGSNQFLNMQLHLIMTANLLQFLLQVPFYISVDVQCPPNTHLA